MANLYAAIETLTQQIHNLEDERNRYKMQVERLEEQLADAVETSVKLLQRKRTLVDAISDLADGNWSCWEDIKADTGLCDKRCQELYELVTEVLWRKI